MVADKQMIAELKARIDGHNDGRWNNERGSDDHGGAEADVQTFG